MIWFIKSYFKSTMTTVCLFIRFGSRSIISSNTNYCFNVFVIFDSTITWTNKSIVIPVIINISKNWCAIVSKINSIKRIIITCTFGKNCATRITSIFVVAYRTISSSDKNIKVLIVVYIDKSWMPITVNTEVSRNTIRKIVILGIAYIFTV